MQVQAPIKETTIAITIMASAFGCVFVLLLSLLLYTKVMCWAGHHHRFLRSAQSAGECSSARSVPQKLHPIAEGRMAPVTTVEPVQQHSLQLAESHTYADAQGSMRTWHEQKHPTPTIALQESPPPQTFALQALRGSRLLTGSRLATTSCSLELHSSSRKLGLDPSLTDAAHRDDLTDERLHDKPLLATPGRQVVSRDRHRVFTTRGCERISLDEGTDRMGAPLHSCRINPVHSGSSPSVRRAKKQQICLADVLNIGNTGNTTRPRV